MLDDALLPALMLLIAGAFFWVVRRGGSLPPSHRDALFVLAAVSDVWAASGPVSLPTSEPN